METDKIVQLHWIGRLGNRMFQYAYGCQYAFLKKLVYYYPSDWEGTLLFKPFSFAQKIPDETLTTCLLRNKNEVSGKEGVKRINCMSEYDLETKFVDFHNFETKDSKSQNIAFNDISIMFQKTNMDLICTEFLRKSVFVFSELVKGTSMYKDLESRKGTYVVAHIRRGDIVSPSYTGGHCAVTLNSYLKQLEKLKINKNDVIFISDDIQIASQHEWRFKGADPGWNYPDGAKKVDDSTIFEFLPDLLTIYFAKTILRGNSGFSWWAAELSGADVYSPIVAMRDQSKIGPVWLDCEFVNNNHPNFMGSGFDDIKFRQSCTERENQYIKTIQAFSVEKDCKVILTNMQLNDNIVQPPSLSDTNMKVYDRHHNFQFPTEMYGQVKSRARTKYKKKPSVLIFIIIVLIIIWSCKCTLKKTRHFEFF